MPQDDLSFPFSAVCGMDDAKHAILCACVNRKLRAVLIRGGPGSAKTVLARSVGGLTGMKVINLPLNASEEQIFGGMDIEETVRQGRPVMNEGVLSRADGNILYVDDINLMDQRVLASVLDCVDSGRVILEREGVSGEYGCDTMLIATMNPSDSDLSSHMLDRFDLCAYSDFPNDDNDGRREILSSKARYIDDPESFVESYADEEEYSLTAIKEECDGRPYRLVVKLRPYESLIFAVPYHESTDEEKEEERKVRRRMREEHEDAKSDNKYVPKIATPLGEAPAAEAAAESAWRTGACDPAGDNPCALSVWTGCSRTED